MDIAKYIIDDRTEERKNIKILKQSKKGKSEDRHSLVKGKKEI